MERERPLSAEDDNFRKEERVVVAVSTFNRNQIARPNLNHSRRISRRPLRRTKTAVVRDVVFDDDATLSNTESEENEERSLHFHPCVARRRDCSLSDQSLSP